MARTVSVTSGGKVASRQVGTPTADVAGVGEFVRTNAHPPAMTISTKNATSANLRGLICAPLGNS
jgi:hypothetical protein